VDNSDGIVPEDWSAAYARCPKWMSVWQEIKDGKSWPKGYQVLHNHRMLKDGLYCVPRELTGRVLRECHSVCGHLGGERLLHEASRQYQFAIPEEAKRVADRMQKVCDYCQAGEHAHQPHNLKVVSTPVPPHVMTSVCIDLFVMPETEYEGQLYNVFAACVDRHSGWMVVTEHHTRGLTAAKVAKAMYTKWWSPHGIPSVITSDRGPHFAGAWWRTMCALHGVRHAYAQAHHHAANGRAEKAGSQLQRQIRMMQEEEGISWVEALPRAVQRIHDAVGQCGLSPYEVLYGRHRPYAGVPYTPPVMAEDAVEFFERQRAIDKKVAERLNTLHESRTAQLNRHRKDLPPLSVNDKVWYRRPRGRPGEKLESYWLGPAIVKERRGEHSYVIQLEENRQQEAHRSQLKSYNESTDDIGPPVKLFRFKQARVEPPTGMDEWNVDKVLGHRRRDGELEFNVQWEGSSEHTWEPLHHFFHHYSQPIVDYFKEKGLKEDVMAHLARHPTEASAVWASAFTKNPTEEAKQEEWPEEWEEPPTEWSWEEDKKAMQ